MKRSNSNPTTSLTKRRSFRGWLKRVTLPNGTHKRVGPDNIPKGGVFGIPLTMSIKYAKTTVGYVDEDNIKHTKAGAIPIVVAKCGSYLKKNGLETEGIFRVSGSIKRINALEFQFDQSASSYGLDLNWEGYTVHDAASLLRRYLNKLPVPVIPFEQYQAFRDVMSNTPYRDTEQRIEAFQKLIQGLQPPHQHLLLYLLDTLSLFATMASETKMDIPNLAAIFCPCILRHPDQNTPVHYKISQYVIEFLIEFQSLFTMQLLVPTKRRNTATSEIPPVPLLVSSSINKANTPPPVPLHVVNPSDPSMLSLGASQLEEDAFIESPLDISAQPKERSVHATEETFLTRTLRFISPYYHMLKENMTMLRHAVEPHIAKPATVFVCGSVLIVTLIVILYEAYLAVTLVSFEPLLFFTGIASYWWLLYYNLINMPVKEVSREIAEEEEDDNGLCMDMNDAEEEAMLKDETIMSEWRDLLTRAWKTNDASTVSLNMTENDISSVMSRSSRFDEEESPIMDSSSDEEEDDDLGFDPVTLEAFLSQYDQIKKDAMLAKKLQIEEQKARDENNPFVVESIAVGDKSISDDEEQVTTPTEKESWKIRVFRD